MKHLRNPLFWPLSDLVRDSAIEGMDHRAEFETELLITGVDITDVHGEATVLYPFYEQFLDGAAIFFRMIGNPIAGSVADLGSGTGTGASIISKMPGVKSVYAIEYSEKFVTMIMPVVFQKFGAATEKIQRVIGDFNSLRIEDNSLDFILEIGAFHHSENLEITLKESWRVLKPGGALICIESPLSDRFTQVEINKMLDQELSDGLKDKYGYTASKSLTRREWGEHEYTVSQWLKAFTKCGYSPIVLSQLYPKSDILRRILNRFPVLKKAMFKISLFLSFIVFRFGGTQLTIFSKPSNNRRLFIAFKPLVEG